MAQGILRVITFYVGSMSVVPTMPTTARARAFSPPPMAVRCRESVDG